MTPPSKNLPQLPTRPNPNGEIDSKDGSVLPRIRGPVGSKKKSKWFLPVVITLVVASGLTAAWVFIPRKNPAFENLIFRPVSRETVQLTVVERGELESARNSDIICRVKAGKQTRNTAIKWLVDAGSRVVPGQVVARLDDSALVKDLEEQEIVTQKAKLDWELARDNYVLLKSQNETERKTAEVALELAEIELKKYQEGDYEQLRKDVQSRILLAESDLEMWNERVSWANRMVKKNFITPTQAESDRSRQRSAKVALDKVKEELRVLRDYTRLHETTRIKSLIATAESQLKQIEVKTRSTESQAINDRDTKRAIYDKELARKQEIEEEIQKCVLRAPQAGLVVYYESERSRRSADSEKIEVGTSVHEGQKLMQIPDLSRMLVSTSVHEASVRHLKGEIQQPTGFRDALRAGLLTTPCFATRLVAIHSLPRVMEQIEADDLREKESIKIYDGQRAVIQVDAQPGTFLEGRVKTVATVASKEWFNDVRMYKTSVKIMDTLKGLKPGMSARVTIYTDEKAENALAVPIQSVIREPGKDGKKYVYVKNAVGVEKRIVETGITNEKMVEITSGLSEGELVAENPQVLDSGVAPGKSSSAPTGQKGPLKGGAGGGRGSR